MKPTNLRERMIIVSITDISPQGDAYCSILTSDSPEVALDQIRAYIDTEVSERGIEVEPDYDDLLAVLSSGHGNEHSGPEEIEYEGSGAGEFIIAVKILEKTGWPQSEETGPSETIPLWLRLGGEILADVESMRRILSGDRNALVETIRRNGFMVNGQAYIPIEDISPELAGLMPEGICQGDDIDFDIGTDRITLRPDSP